MVKNRFLQLSAVISAVLLCLAQPLFACTGISLKAKDGSKIVGRTMEWGGFVMESHYLVVPRGFQVTSMTPQGMNGVRIVGKYGYVGIGVLENNFIAEGVNEKGLMGELFYFPGFGEYEEYNPALNASTMVDAQLLSWVLGNFATVSEMEKELKNIHIVPYGHGFGATHYRIADATGRDIVLEFIDGKVKIYENRIGVITNAPSFDWHMTNLRNYMNLFSGAAPDREIAPGLTLKPIGAGSASLGLPGDVTPPSRFVRAAFYLYCAPQQETGKGSVMQLFQILNNFDIPLGAEFSVHETIPDMLSATQWTTAVDLKALKFYYKTEWNYTIRCIDLKEIDFSRVDYQIGELDRVKEQPVEYISIK